MSTEVQNESPVITAAREIKAEVHAIPVDPHKLVDAVIDRVAAMDFPAQNREKAAALIRGLRQVEQQQGFFSSRTYDAVTTSVRNVKMEALYDRLAFFESEARKLLQVPAPKLESWDQHLHRWCRDGWTQFDLSLDRLWPHVSDGRNTTDRIVAISAEAVTLSSGAVLSRKMLGLAPIPRPIHNYR